MTDEKRVVGMQEHPKVNRVEVIVLDDYIEPARPSGVERAS